MKQQNTKKHLQDKLPVVGNSVSFYQDRSKDLTDNGKVVRIIINDSDETNPILEIKPSTMNYERIWRTVKELINL